MERAPPSGDGSAPTPRSHAAQGATRLLCGRMSARVSLRALFCFGSDRCATTFTCTLVRLAGLNGDDPISDTPTTGSTTANRILSTGTPMGNLAATLGAVTVSQLSDSLPSSSILRWKAGLELPPLVSTNHRVCCRRALRVHSQRHCRRVSFD